MSWIYRLYESLTIKLQYCLGAREMIIRPCTVIRDDWYDPTSEYLQQQKYKPTDIMSSADWTD